MIQTRFFGRSGNQMFQWAAGRGLAHHHHTNVVADDRLPRRMGQDTITDFFGLPSAAKNDLPPEKDAGFVRYALWRKLGKDPKFCRESHPGFNANFFDFPANSYLHGYWHNEKYFENCKDDIRKDFAFPDPSSQNAEAAAAMNEVDSISVHVRRGDYLAIKSLSTCGPEYYAQAFDQIVPKIDKDPVFFVFTDDPDWSREHLKVPGDKHVIDHNTGSDDIWDIWLMSNCSHHVMANSSFSWWGAWLNPDPEKVVVTPKSPAKKDDWPPDALPRGWIAVDQAPPD